jgi:hypothetical protein
MPRVINLKYYIFNFNPKLVSMVNTFLSTKVGKIFQLFFAVYAAIWGVAEPLNLTWITNHPTSWRIVLLAAAGILTMISLLDLAGPDLETIDATTIGKTLLDFASYGHPTCRIIADGRVGSVMTINSDY